MDGASTKIRRHPLHSRTLSAQIQSISIRRDSMQLTWIVYALKEILADQHRKKIEHMGHDGLRIDDDHDFRTRKVKAQRARQQHRTKSHKLCD